MKHEDSVVQAAFNPGGRRVVTASADNTSRVWDATTGQPIAPPMEHKGTVWHAEFSLDGRSVLTASADHMARIWDIPSDDREEGDLILLAHLLSGSLVDTGGALLPLTPKEFRDAWQTLRTKYPRDFVASEAEVLAWHRREVDACEAQEAWDSAIVHLDRLIVSEPREGGLYARRGCAAELGRWKEAAADHSKAIGLEPKNATHWIDRGDVYAELDLWDRACAEYTAAVELGADDQKRRALARLAEVKLAQNDAGAFRQVCADLVGQFNQDENPDGDYTVAWTCVLVPDAVADWAEVERLARRAVEAAKTDDDRHYFLSALGAANCRAGSFEEAVTHLNESIRARKGGDPLDWLFLAQAHQLGPLPRRKAMADQSHRLDRFIHQKPTERRLLHGRVDWYTWLELQVLRREAEALVKGSKGDAQPTKP